MSLVIVIAIFLIAWLLLQACAEIKDPTAASIGRVLVIIVAVVLLARQIGLL